MTYQGMRVLIVADAGAPSELISEAVLTSLPSASVEVLDEVALRSMRIPAAACAVIDTKCQGRSGVEALRAIRAAGFVGAAIVLVAEVDPVLESRVRPLGVKRCVLRADVATALPAALVATGAGAEEEQSPAMLELRRIQMLIARGETAGGFQHAVNNALTPLLAEAQLLEMEAETDAQRETAKRVVALCREVVAVVRRASPA